MHRFESLEPRRHLAGDLVSTFGDRGRVTLTAGSIAVDVVEQTTGKLVVLSVNKAGTQSTLQRLNANGSVDTGFATRTFAASPTGTQLKQSGDGSLLVLSGGTLRKLTPAGIVDTGFRTSTGIGGFDMTPDGGLYGFVQSGTVTIYGQPQPTFSNIVRRFRSNGVELSRKTLTALNVQDPTRENPNVVLKLLEINVTAQGQFLAAADELTTAFFSYGAAIRWTADGALDASYSDDGIALYDVDFDANHNDLQVLPSGRAIIAQNFDDGEAHLYEFNADGSFDSDGIAFDVRNYGRARRVVARGNDGYVFVGSFGAGDAYELGGDLTILGTDSYGDQTMGVYDPSATGDARYGMSYFGFQATAGERLAYGQATAGVFTRDGDFVAVGRASGQTAYADLVPTVAVTKFGFATPVAQRVGEIAWVENDTLYVETGATNDRIEFYNDPSSMPSTVQLLPADGGFRFGVLYFDATRTVVNAFAGNDTITGSGLADQFFGGTGDDSLLGGLGNDTIEGGSGRDTLIGDAGNDVLIGGAGQDFAEGRAGNDSLYGGADQDNLFGGSGNDLIEGNAGNDFLVGEAGNDGLFGGSGNDTMNGGSGTDFLDGNDGIDTELFRSSMDTRYNMEIFA